MKPIELDQDGRKGWKLVHECEKCGKNIANKAAPDDELTRFMENRDVSS
jgi:hypothetical protein